MTQEDIYYQSARNFFERYKIEATEHIADVAVSVMRTRDGIWQGGSFVQSIIENDLESAISRADNQCVQHLKTFVLIKRNCFVDSELKYYKV